MSMNASLIYDLIFLALFAFAAVRSWQKGFLAGLIELIGAVLGVGVAVWASRQLAQPCYDLFLSDAVNKRVTEAVTQSGGDLAAAVQALDFLPASLRQTIADLVLKAGADLPEQINALLVPVLLPFVQVLLFVVLCVLIRWVFRLLVGLLRHVNAVPLLGGVNRLLGLALGLCTGALDCWLLALALWFVANATAGALTWLNTDVLAQSVGYGIFGAYNPFVPTVG